MQNKSTPKFTIDALADRMRAGAKRNAAGTGQPIDTEARTLGSRSTDSDQAGVTGIKLQPPFQPRTDDHYHANDLLKYHDRAFVQNAYRAILKRGPDATGFEAFMDGLRGGRLNKIDVLARLRYSKEGRAKAVRIDGLFFPASVRLLYSVPLLGYILNLVVAVARLPRSIRNEQQFQAHVSAQQQLIADHANHVAQTLTSLSREVRGSLETISHAHRQQVEALINERAGTEEAALRLIAEARKQFEQLLRERDERDAEIASGLSELTARFETAWLAEQAARESALGGFSRALQGEQDAREKTLGELHRAIQGEQAARENSHGELSRAIQGEQAARENSRGELSRAIQDEQAARENSHGELGGAIQGEQAARGNSHEELSRAIQSEQAAREAAAQTLAARLDEERSGLQTELASVAQRLSSSNDSLQTRNDLLARDLKAEMRKLFQKQQEVRTELVLQGERLARFLDEAGGGTAGEPGHQSQAFGAEAEHSLDAFYFSLEDRFRGDRGEVMQRLRVYLPMIEEARVGGKKTPILDVGCGRGEWLELLKSEGHLAGGIDSNRLMVQECKERELKVEQADLISHVRSLPDASLGAITGFHIIEHLPFNVLIAFLGETVRVLKPGGLVIFETPNPQNVLVGSCNFYFDPTHRNPLPAPVMKFVLESRGFVSVDTIELNPSDDAPVPADSDLARRFNQYFYGPMDYAVVGRRL